MSESDLERLVRRVQKSAKYRHVSPDLIREIGARELAIRGKWKTAVKATKSKLHQIGGAYFHTQIDYERALADLRAAAADAAACRAVCRELMGLHASTAERLPLLDEFYPTVLAGVPRPQTVLDVACGLNPLSWPWLPWREGVRFYAYDIYADMVDFLNQFMALAGFAGEATVRDVVGDPPSRPADLALLLKLLPVLEQVDGTAVPRLLDALQARRLLISFPAQSLGGRDKGMAPHYQEQFERWAAGRPWRTQRFLFETELVFLVNCEW